MTGWRQQQAQVKRDRDAKRLLRLGKLAALNKNLEVHGAQPLFTLEAAAAMDRKSLREAVRASQAYLVHLAKVMTEADQ